MQIVIIHLQKRTNIHEDSRKWISLTQGYQAPVTLEVSNSKFPPTSTHALPFLPPDVSCSHLLMQDHQIPMTYEASNGKLPLSHDIEMSSCLDSIFILVSMLCLIDTGYGRVTDEPKYQSNPFTKHHLYKFT